MGKMPNDLSLNTMANPGGMVHICNPSTLTEDGMWEQESWEEAGRLASLECAVQQKLEICFNMMEVEN